MYTYRYDFCFDIHHYTQSICSDQECDEVENAITHPIRSRFFSFAFDCDAANKPFEPCDVNLSRTPSLTKKERFDIQHTIPETKAQQKGREQAGLSDSDVAHLLRCICCDAKWTTRKTARQKSAHIRTCSKKHNIRTNVLDLLMHKELAKQALEKIARSHSQSRNPLAEEKVSAQPFEPRTLLEEAVAEPSKKRRRRREDVATIKNVSESHDLINNRAKVFLAAPAVAIYRSNSSTAPSSTGPTSASVTDKERDSSGALHMLPPATQSFAPSRLQSRIQIMPHGYNTLESDAPPSTQPFGISKLTAAKSRCTYEAVGQ